MKKILIIALFAMILLCSCQKGGVAQNTGAPAAQEDNRSEPELPAERLSPDLPEADYNGHEFKIMVTSDEGDVVRNDFFAAEITGDAINDAIYMRNLYVEDKYGVKISNISTGWSNGNGVSLIKKSASAGDYAYDAAMTTVYDACSLAVSGLVLNLNAVPHIDLSRQWWDRQANRDLVILGKMYFTTGDISRVSNDSTYAVLFNKKLVRDHETENPYELVKSGAWTYDKMAELGKSIGADLNGDGAFDENDLYGAIVEDDVMMSVISSIGERSARINESGEIELSLYNERTALAVKKYTDWVFDKTAVYAYQRYVGKVGDYRFLAMFENDQSLFLLRGMETIEELRAMETDFGILPFPKLDDRQREYYSPVGAWKAMFISIPSVQGDLGRTTLITEALAAESLYTLRPAYYDVTMKGKHARDEESVEMLDVILSTRIYDFGWYYQFGGFNNHIMDLFRNYNSDFTSMYEKYKDKAESDIQKINEQFRELAG